MKVDVELDTIIEEFNNTFRDALNISIFSRATKYQRSKITALSKYIRHLDKIKSRFTENRLNKESNLILAFQHGILAVQEELRMILNLKKSSYSDAWNNLVNAQSLAGNIVRNNIAGLESFIGYAHKLEAYEKLLFPKMLFSSYGGIILEAECSICRQNYDDCTHIKGMYYMGVMCSKVIKKIDLEEISVVPNPADKRARLTSFTDRDGRIIDLLTLNVFPSK